MSELCNVASLLDKQIALVPPRAQVVERLAIKLLERAQQRDPTLKIDERAITTQLEKCRVGLEGELSVGTHIASLGVSVHYNLEQDDVSQNWWDLEVNEVPLDVKVISSHDESERARTTVSWSSFSKVSNFYMHGQDRGALLVLLRTDNSLTPLRLVSRCALHQTLLVSSWGENSGFRAGASVGGILSSNPYARDFPVFLASRRSPRARACEKSKTMFFLSELYA